MNMKGGVLIQPGTAELKSNQARSLVAVSHCSYITVFTKIIRITITIIIIYSYAL